MPSLTGDLRAQTTARVLAMSIADRIALALSLGDDDLELFVRASGLDRNAARRQLTEHLARLGARRVLQKPFNPATLASVVRGILSPPES